jgi:hypothetical protein
MELGSKRIMCIVHLLALNALLQQKYYILVTFRQLRPSSSVLGIKKVQVLYSLDSSNTLYIEIREVWRVDVDLSQLNSTHFTAEDGRPCLKIKFQISLVFNDIDLEFRVTELDNSQELISESVSYRA